MKEKLSEIIQKAVGGCAKYWADVIAEKLVAEGVIVPPCKVGDKAYHLTGIDTQRELDLTDIFEGKVCSISKQEDALWIYCSYNNGLTYWYTESDIGRKLFLTREDAEKALANGTHDLFKDKDKEGKKK